MYRLGSKLSYKLKLYKCDYVRAIWSAALKFFAKEAILTWDNLQKEEDDKIHTDMPLAVIIVNQHIPLDAMSFSEGNLV